MADAIDLGEVFKAERPRLLAIAYRMLGTLGDAEDVVQDSFLRFCAAGPASIESPRGFLTTVVVRLCLDVLKSARFQRERYEGLWLPEPVRTDDTTLDRTSIAMAFLVLLETLSPEERAVYVLHEIFDHTHPEIAAMLHKSEDACRQMLRRAHQRVAARRPRYAIDDGERLRLVSRFMTACMAGDIDAMRALLTEDAIVSADGGGKAGAAPNPVGGADRVARFVIGFARKGADLAVEPAELNGAPGIVLRNAGAIDSAVVLELAGDGRIQYIQIVRNPDKLARL